MRSRRVLAFLLGAWLAGSLFMVVFDSQNYRSVSRLLENQNHPAVRQILTLGAMEARADLQYFVAELTRGYKETWEWLQLILVILIGSVLLLSAHFGRWTIIAGGLMVAGAMLQRFVLTPEMVRLGHLVEFVPASVYTEDRATFFAYSGAYNMTEVALLGIGVALTLRVLLNDAIRRLLARGSLDVEDGWDDDAGNMGRRGRG